MPNSNSAVCPVQARRLGIYALLTKFDVRSWAGTAARRGIGWRGDGGDAGGRATTVAASPAAAAGATVESLEGRQMLSAVYVSSVWGRDNWPGRDGDKPVRTIAKAKSMMRDGDQLYLRAGQSWNESFGQWDRSNTLIASYGSGAKPKINTRDNGIWINQGGQRNVTLRGIHINGLYRTNKVGIGLVGAVSNLTLDNVEVRGFRMNVNLIGSRGSIRDVTIRNSDISNANGAGKSSGLFAEGVAGLTIDNSTFDRNGGTSGSMYNHGAYITALCSNVVVRNSTFSNSSSHGLQARAGGTITGNKFINNSVGLSVGIVNGAGVHASGGVSINVSNNTFAGRGIARNRGLGMEVGNVRSGTIANNTFHDGSRARWNAAILLAKGTAGGSKTGINSLKIVGNDVSGWGAKLMKNSNAGIRNLVVSGNNF